MEIAEFPAADRDRARDALALPSRLHAADRRQSEPYASHLPRVTIRILSHYRATDPDVACAALLHDAVEDHAAGIAPGGRKTALAVLAGRFGARIAALVAAVTQPRMGARPRQARIVRRARPGQPGGQPLGAGDHGLGLHRQRRGHPHHRTETVQAHPQVQPSGASAARAHPGPGHPAGRPASRT